MVGKDASTQTIDICACDHEHHPALLADTFFTGAPHWISGRDTPDRIGEMQNRVNLFGLSISRCHAKIVFRKFNYKCYKDEEFWVGALNPLSYDKFFVDVPPPQPK